MPHAKIFSLLVAAVLGLYGAMGFYFLPLATFEGDLTRVGMLPETYFGWTSKQPDIAPELLQQASWEDADVLVIGDSFSEPLIWQSVLSRNGLKVRTETWGTVPAICEDFTQWLGERGFKGRHVIFEIIERNTEGTLNNSLGCKVTKYRPATQSGVPAPGLPGKISVGYQVYFNTLRYEHEMKGTATRLYWPNDVYMEHISNGCTLFSHHRCDDVLFYAKDRETDMGADILSNMEVVASRAKKVPITWAIIPDKTTTYLHPEKQFWNNAQQRLNAPNVLDVFRQSLRKQVIDLYPANNTHLSVTGYLILGDAVYRSLPQ